MTYVLIMIIFLLIFYLIIYNQINKIRKEYLKSDIIEEIRDITEAFSNKANEYIEILEDMIKNIELKEKELKNIINQAEKVNLINLLDNNKIKNWDLNIEKKQNEILDEKNGLEENTLFKVEETVNNEVLNFLDNNERRSKDYIKNGTKVENKKYSDNNKIELENEVNALIKLGKSFEEIAELLDKPVGEIKLLYNIIKLKKGR
ncbi:MAG: hypothetical protein N3A58_05540 [Spirochaetes bacterium]|nr:hypothetical protein [Spirochaetota bacterium]